MHSSQPFEWDRSLKINQLENFPFSTFEELQNNVNDGRVYLGLRIGLDHELYKSPYHSGWKKVYVNVLSSTIFIIPISLLVYMIVSGNWISLWVFPLLIIANTIFAIKTDLKPHLTFYQPTKRLIKVGYWSLLIYSILENSHLLASFALPLIIQASAISAIRDIPHQEVQTRILNNEGLFCELWQGKQLSLKFKDGKTVTNFRIP